MIFSRKSVDKLTFRQRLLEVALMWGLPIVGIEIYGLNARGLLAAAIIILPSTAVGIFVFALMEHALFSRPDKSAAERETKLAQDGSKTRLTKGNAP